MSKIAIDVTPLLPGGINGGAKPMVMALLQELPKILSKDEFILWTADYSHTELAFLDRPNLQRTCVHHSIQATSEVKSFTLKSLVQKIWNWTKRWLPQQLQMKLRAFYYRNHAQPITATSLYKEQAVDLLFCPFGAPRFYNPNTPTLSVIYDLQFLDHPEFFTEQERFYRQLHFNQICELADQIATISEFTRQSVLKNSSLQSQQVTTIHIGFVHEYPAIDPREQQVFLERLALKSQGYLFYPANFWAHKNHDALLEGFKLFRQKHPTSELKLVFTGALDDRRAALLAKATQLGLNEYIVMPGFLSDEEVGLLYQNAKGLIFPSLYEGFGIPLMEAMQAEIPVACSNVTSLPEVGGEAVLYFDPQNNAAICEAIETLVFNDAVCAELVEKGCKRLTKFGDSVVMAQQYAKLIEQMLDKNKEIRRYGLHGLTEDRWFQENAYLALPDSPSSRSLEFSFQVPNWMPDELEITFTQTSNLLAAYRGTPGESLQIGLDLPTASGIIEIRFSPVFTPVSIGIANDNRLLSVLCAHFQIKSPEGIVYFDALQMIKNN